MIVDVWLGMLIVALATWRITSLFVNEDGPFDVFANLRARVGVYYDEYSVARGKNVVASALTCVWCTSPYVALILVCAWIYQPLYAILVFLPFAISAVAILIEAGVNQKA